MNCRPQFDRDNKFILLQSFMAALQVLCRDSANTLYPLLATIARICASAPVTNAWPERGVSAVRRIKTRYYLD